MSKNIVTLFLLSFLVLWGSTISATAEGYQPLRVEPSRFIFEAEPGKQVTGTLQVSNNGAEPATVRAILSDWTLGPNNELKSLEPNTLKSTLHNWIKFNPRQFTIAPGKTQTVRFSIKIPQGISQVEQRGLIGFEQTIPYQGELTGADIKVQVASTIYVSIPPIERKCMVVGSQLEISSSEGNSSFHLNLRGIGSAHFRGTGSFQIYIPGEKEPITSGSLGPLVVLPEVETRFSGDIDQILPPDTYHIVVEVLAEDNLTDPVIRQIYAYTVPKL